MAFATSIDELNARDSKPEDNTGAKVEIENKETEPKVEENNTGTSKSNPEEISWLNDFNKAFNTEYKTKEDVNTLLSRARMTDDLETKVNQIPEFEKREKEYKEKLEKANSSLKVNPLKFFSSPESYKAEALKIQFPDKNPNVLQDVVTKDLSKMDNVEVLIKGLMLTENDLTYEDARGYIQKKYGIEDDDPADWSPTLKTELKIEANKVRREMEALKEGVKIPDFETDEQIQTRKIEAKSKLEADLKPQIEDFSKFDKFTTKINDDYTLEFDVPEEFKATLPDMFKGYFIDGDIEYNEENIRDCEDIRNAMLIYHNLPKVYAAIEDDIKVKMTKENDDKLGNKTPLSSQTNIENEEKLPGIHDFVTKNK